MPALRVVRSGFCRSWLTKQFVVSCRWIGDHGRPTIPEQWPHDRRLTRSLKRPPPICLCGREMATAAQSVPSFAARVWRFAVGRPGDYLVGHAR